MAVFSKDGRLPFEKADATNARDIYAVELNPVPRDFRVVVAWDANGQANPSKLFNLGEVVLSADVRNYNPATDVVYVDPVTTMVTGLLLRRPDFGLHRSSDLGD